MMKLRPLGNRVLVRPQEKTDKTPGGILLPDTAKEKPLRGEVIAVGPGKRLDDGAYAAPEVKVGQVVFYQTWSGTEVKEADGMLVMSVDDLLGVLDE